MGKIETRIIKEIMCENEGVELPSQIKKNTCQFVGMFWEEKFLRSLFLSVK